MTLSERIRLAMTEAKITQVELARRVGIAAPSVHGWLTGKAKFLRGENLLKAAEVLGVNPDWLSTGKGQMHAPESPRLAFANDTRNFEGAMGISTDPDDPYSYRIQKVQLQLRAGVTGFQTVPEIHEGGTINLSKTWVDKRNYRPAGLIAVTVKGDSMEPNLYEGDVVIINTDDKKMVDGTVYAFNYEGEAVIKRLVRERGAWWLFSDNQDQSRHRPRGCTEGECIVVGRVVKRETERI